MFNNNNNNKKNYERNAVEYLENNSYKNKKE